MDAIKTHAFGPFFDMILPLLLFAILFKRLERRPVFVLSAIAIGYGVPVLLHAFMPLRLKLNLLQFTWFPGDISPMSLIHPWIISEWVLSGGLIYLLSLRFNTSGSDTAR